MAVLLQCTPLRMHKLFRLILVLPVVVGAAAFYQSGSSAAAEICPAKMLARQAAMYVTHGGGKRWAIGSTCFAKRWITPPPNKLTPSQKAAGWSPCTTVVLPQLSACCLSCAVLCTFQHLHAEPLPTALHPLLLGPLPVLGEASNAGIARFMKRAGSLLPQK